MKIAGVNDVIAAAVSLIILVILMRFFNKTEHFSVYLIFAIVLFFSAYSKDILFIESGLMLLYGLFYGSIAASGMYKKTRWQMISYISLRNLQFIIISAAFYAFSIL
jgi:hypothetical protein